MPPVLLDWTKTTDQLLKKANRLKNSTTGHWITISR